MTPLDILTIIGVIGCYSYAGFLWKSDESRPEKEPKENILTCRLCNKIRNRCCCGSSYLATNEDLYKAKANCSGHSTVDFTCDDGRRITMKGVYREGAFVLLIRRTEGDVTTHYYLDERIRDSRK